MFDLATGSLCRADSAWLGWEVGVILTYCALLDVILGLKGGTLGRGSWWCAGGFGEIIRYRTGWDDVGCGSWIRELGVGLGRSCTLGRYYLYNIAEGDHKYV
jgi:hypothetical protein